MSIKVQYSPESDITEMLRIYPFAYDLEDHDGFVIMTMILLYESFYPKSPFGE